jgi:disulfide bond formation protein DsbB
MVLRGASIFAALALLGVFLVTCLPHPGHHHGKEGACSLCQIGRLPFLKSAVSAAFTLIFSTTWVTRPAHPVAAHEILISAGPSRAPPA